ncbi:pyrimidine/purine nucleoside phosphorylase [Denitromonas iodatirespirans]|uniref:Pyrimidine/purine nucleoside phosphorylase n=1 Tax=Denitromonas iodatirespirans TaxID=2795389 RepID=A0A944H800_DENI1|nr:pyrimidine/purine nucleoside phosphorylase [Denitromonas iodatirespirans]MBT0960850.1 pyrimidine/purine nucleoside phosphorylase [Denitromonas iodatirespirans]
MTEKALIDGVSVAKEANVYFGGKCVSHNLTLPDGSRKSVGVILPATLTFNTGAPEVMEIVAGACSVRMGGEAEWRNFEAGQTFSVAASSSFDIQVVGTPMHYVCHFG